MGTAVVAPTLDSENPDVPATVFRHTYVQDGQTVEPKVLLPPRRNITKSYKDKTVRNIRLRPRQVLCSKCKLTCLDDNGEKPKPIGPPHQQNQTHDTEQYKPELRKRRSLVEEPPELQKRTRRYENQQQCLKSTPVIKISFTSAKGEGKSVLQIPARSQEDQNQADNVLQQNESTLCSKSDKYSIDETCEEENIRRGRKTLKKAKHREKWRGNGLIDNENDQNNRTRLTRHKHRHRHHDDLNNCMNSKQLSINLQAEVEECQENLPHYSPHNNSDSHGNKGKISDNFLENWSRERKRLLGQSYDLEDTIHLDPTHLNKTILESLGHGAANKKTKSDSSRLSTSSGNSRHTDNSIMNDSESDTHSHPDMNELEVEDFPRSDTIADDLDEVKPLLMRIHTRNVTKCVRPDGKDLCIGDVVWGKIHGFPWWPGKVVSITINQRDNGAIIRQTAHVSWFGSSTMSMMPCSELNPFLEDFELRFNKKKRGPYKNAVKQATIAARHVLGGASLPTGVEEDLAD